MSAAEKKKQAQEEAEEELLVGLDDTPGKNDFSTHEQKEGKINKETSISIFPHIYYYLIVLLLLIS
jgi:hypothetical protein